MLLASNIVNREKTSKIAGIVLQHMKEAICRSLGPYGAPTIVGVDDADILMTKDGYHIINMVAFNEPIAMTFAKIIKNLSKELVSAVGDGSTTCVVAAYHFFVLLQEEMNNGQLKDVRQKEIMDTINKLIELIVKEIKKISKPVSDDLSEIKALASVSLNNNVEMGEMIANIYKKIGTEGYINVELGNSPVTYTDETDGFMINFGRMDEIFVNNDYNQSELDECAILMFNSAINSKEHEKYVADVLEQINQGITSYKSLLIIAPGIGAGLINRLRNLINAYTKQGVRLNFNIIQYSTSTEFDRAFLYDIGLMCGATVITETEKEEGNLVTSIGKNSDTTMENSIANYIGYAKKIVSGKRTTTFYGGSEVADKIELEKNKILTELKEIEFDERELVRKYELRKRLATLTKKIVTIYVGGYNEANRKSDKELIDDAVNACRSAIKNGYVIGGNLAISEAIKNIDINELTGTEICVLDLISESFKLVLKDVLGNMYDLTLEKDKEIVDSIVKTCTDEYLMYDLIDGKFTSTDIINPADTDIEILKHATSIISLILTSNQFISRNTNELITELE